MIETSSTREGLGKRTAGERRLRVLSLCLLYPNPTQPDQGVFIERRLKHLADIADVQVVAPFALVQYGNRSGRRVRIGKTGCPPRRQDGKITVLHPWWFYPPYGGSLTPFCLFVQLLYKLKRLRRQFAFDILDAHFGYPDGIAGCLLASALDVPFTITFRGNEPKHSRSWAGRRLLAYAVRKASRVFAVSESLRAFVLAMGADAEKVRTVPNGVDETIFWPRDKEKCRVEHRLPRHARVILSAGALVERKGHHRAIEALKLLEQDGTAAYLVVAGGPGPEGAYEKVLRRLVTSLNLDGSVRFCGSVGAEEMSELMSAADILCLASTNEGWPNVVHEALACGTPVVATNVGAIPEMLADGRGIIVRDNGAVPLKEALAAAFQGKWDRGSISAWARGRSWDQVAFEVCREMEMLMPAKAKLA